MHGNSPYICKRFGVSALVTLLLLLSGQESKATVLRPDAATYHAADTTSYPGIAIRNNLLYDISGTLNIGFEIPITRHLSFGANLGFKSWPRFYMWERHEDVNAKWKHLLIVPEVRWWPGDEMYTGHFFGLDAIYTHYNVGAVKFPLGMYKEVRRHRLQGDFYGIGLFYGYSWWLGSRIRLEAEAGLAVGKADGEKFECVHCGTKIGEYSDVALVPKLGLNLAFGTRPNYRHGGKGMGETIYRVDTLVTPPALFLVRLQELPQTQSAGDSLSRRHPYVMPMHKYRPLTELPAPGRDSMLYVHFPYDRTELIYDFDGNAPVLDTIVGITRRLQADEAVGGTFISIVGLASIEGRQKHNIELSEGRAQALRDYVIGETDMEEKDFELLGKGEAWDWFEAQLAAADSAHAADAAWALDIIARYADPDRREAALKADPARYARISEHFLADQRNSGYIRIYYETLPDPKTSRYNKEVIPLIRTKHYADAVRRIERDPVLRQAAAEDPEVMNAYAIAKYLQAVEDDILISAGKYHPVREQDYQDATAEAESLLEQAAGAGSDAAAANLDAVRKYNDSRELYRRFVMQEYENKK